MWVHERGCGYRHGEFQLELDGHGYDDEFQLEHERGYEYQRGYVLLCFLQKHMCYIHKHVLIRL